jgi:Xaa-Pro aminopeptidase
MLTPKDPHSIKRPPVYSDDSSSTLVARSAYEHKINDVESIKEKVDTAERLEDIRKLMAKDKLDY